MSGALTIQKFQEDEALRLRGQLEMRTRIAKWMRETANKCRVDVDEGTRVFGKFFDGVASEIETLDPQ